MSNFSAVLVGINSYKSDPLRGCIIDTVIMRDLLIKKYKVPASSIRLILDDRATKNNIEERLEWLVSNDSENKFFYYSGHGAQIPIQDYSANNHEVDGMNELLCPVDFSWNGTYILDNDINNILNKMKKEHHMTMVIDACHSGTISRGISDLIWGLKTPGYHKIKTIPTPLDLISRVDIVNLADKALGMTLEEAFGVQKPIEPKRVLRKTKVFSTNNVSILTGCREDQTSADAYIGNRFQGALSYFMQGILLRELHISLRDLRAQCAVQLNNNKFTQIPQLIASEENVDKPFIQV